MSEYVWDTMISYIPYNDTVTNYNTVLFANNWNMPTDGNYYVNVDPTYFLSSYADFTIVKKKLNENIKVL